MDPYVPFCGLPPTPVELMKRWTFDPWLIAALAVALMVIVLRTQGRGARPALIGWALVAVLFVSPLCAASMALFSARVAQHLLLTLVAAPLLAPLMRGRTMPPALAGILFGALFWLWHVPGPYALTLQSDLVYWAMHLSLLGAAIALWQALRTYVEHAPFATALTLAGTAAQMTFLSVLLIVAQDPWHPWHIATTVPYGMTATTDQALAGGLMWVAGGMIFATLVAALALRLLGRAAGSRRTAAG